MGYWLPGAARAPHRTDVTGLECRHGPRIHGKVSHWDEVDAKPEKLRNFCYAPPRMHGEERRPFSCCLCLKSGWSRGELGVYWSWWGFGYKLACSCKQIDIVSFSNWEHTMSASIIRFIQMRRMEGYEIWRSGIFARLLFLHEQSETKPKKVCRAATVHMHSQTSSPYNCMLTPNWIQQRQE